MNECKIANAFEGTGYIWGFGVGLAMAWVALYILSWVGVWLWAWMDDGKMPKNNPLLRKMAILYGWKECDGPYAYGKGNKRTDGELFFFFPLFFFMLSPLLIIFYEVTLFISSGIALLHLARFARRHKKLFDKHIKDPNAHKE